MLKTVGVASFILGALIAIVSAIQFSKITSDVGRSKAAAWRAIEGLKLGKEQSIASLGSNHALLRQYSPRLKAQYDLMVRQYDDRLKVQSDLINLSLSKRTQRARRDVLVGLLIGAFFCLVSVPLMMASSGLLWRTLYETLPVAFFGGAVYAAIRAIQKMFTDPSLDGHTASETAAFAIGFFVPQFLMFSLVAYLLSLPVAALIIWNKEQSKS